MLMAKLEEKLHECIEKNPDTAAIGLGEEIAIALIELYKGMEGEKEDRQKWFKETLGAIEDYTSLAEI